MRQASAKCSSVQQGGAQDQLKTPVQTGPGWKLPVLDRPRTGVGRTARIFYFFKGKEEGKEKEERKGRRAAMGVWRRAEEWGALLDAGVVKNQSALARHLGVSRARVSEVLAVRGVHGDLRQTLLRAEDTERPVTDRVWRKVRRLPPASALALLREWGFE